MRRWDAFDVTAVVLLLLAVAAFALCLGFWIASIWTGDDRFFETSGVCLTAFFPLLVAGIVVLTVPR